MMSRRLLRVSAALAALVLLDLAVGRRFPFDRPSAPVGGSPVVFAPSRVRQFPPNAEADINALGFRDRDRSTNRPEETTRILVVGDSFVESPGEPRETTIPADLERRLAHSLDKSVEVWNCGMRGGSPAMYRWWADTLAAFAPTLVVLVVTDSDLNDDARAVVSADQYRSRAWHSLPAPLRRSAFLSRATGVWAALRAAAVRFRLAHTGPHLTLLSPVSAGLDADVDADSLAVLRDPERATLDWERTRGYLNQTTEALDARSIPTLVVHLPARGALPDAPGPAAESPAPDSRAFRHALFADWLAGWAATSATPYVDLGRPMTDWYAAAGNPPLYDPAGRLNAAGLKKAAEWIEPELESLLVVHTARRAQRRIAP